MSLFSKIFEAQQKNKSTNTLKNAADTTQGYARDDRNRFLSALNGGQQVVRDYAENAMSSAMPQFDARMQDLQESSVRRGISTGDLGTSFEGDLASAFQKNIADSVASQAGNVWGNQVGGYGQLANQSSNQWLDILSGNADRDQANKNAKTGFWSSLAGGVGGIVGGFLGGR